MDRQKAIQDTIDNMEHCLDVGNIVFQVPEDKYIIQNIIISLKKQLKVKVIPRLGETDDCMCPTCNKIYLYRNQLGKHCINCGQAFDL